MAERVKYLTEDGVRRLWLAIEQKFIDEVELETGTQRAIASIHQVDPTEMTDADIDAITGYTTPAAVNKAADFSDAIAAHNKTKLVLQNDLSVAEPVVISAGKTVTVALNGSTLEYTGARNSALFEVNGGTLILTGDGVINANGNVVRADTGATVIVEGGTYDSNSSGQGFASVGNGTKIIFNDGILSTQEGGLMAFDGGEIEINGGVFNTRDNFALGTNGTGGRGNNTIVMNGGTIHGRITSSGYEAVGVYIANNDTFIMNGGIIEVVNGCGICQRGGTVKLQNGAIIVTTDENYAPGGVGDKKKNLEADGVIFDEAALYPGHEGMNLTVEAGFVINVPAGQENVRVYAANGIEPDVVIK